MITDYRISLKLEHYICMVDLFDCAGDLEGISGFLFTLGWYCLSLNTRGVGSLLPVPVLIPGHRPTYQTNTGIFRDLKSASTWRKSVVYLEGTLYPSIFLLENGRDIMPTAHNSGRV